MKENKSIDGLSTRDAKKSQVSAPSKIAQKKINIKVNTSPKNNPPTTKVKPATKTATSAGIKANPSEQISDDKPQNTPATPTREEILAAFTNPVGAFDFTENTKDSSSDTPELNQNTQKVPADKKSDNTHEKSMKKSSEKPEKVKKKPSKARETIAIILLVIVFLLIGGVLWAIFWGNDIIAKITGGQGTVFDALTFIDEKYDPLKTDANGRTNILAFGTSGYDMTGDEGDGIHDGAQLTDSIMVISLNQETGDIAMISLPRDLMADTCTATSKINEVYWCNNMDGSDEVAGATALMAEVGEILGIDFQYYTHVNWGSLISIVDLLGGIDVTLDETIDDTGWTDAYYEAGQTYHLNGEEALGLARARHGTTSGDFSRGASQQKILIGIKDKLTTADLSITDLLSLANTLGDNLRTNFTLPEMKTLAHLLSEFDFESMRQVTLLDYDQGIRYMTTGMVNGISYVLPSAGVGNYDDIQEYIAIKFSSDPRIYEEPSILVLNASDEPGIAANKRTELIEAGYTDVTADNAPEGGTYDNGTSLYVVNRKPGTLTMLENYLDRYAESADTLPDSISRDYDFIIILNPETTTEETK